MLTIPYYIYNFHAQIDWTEPWLISLNVFHIVCLLFTFGTAKYFNVQVVYFLMLCKYLWRNFVKGAEIMIFLPALHLKVVFRKPLSWVIRPRHLMQSSSHSIHLSVLYKYARFTHYTHDIIYMRALLI